MGAVRTLGEEIVACGARRSELAMRDRRNHLIRSALRWGRALEALGRPVESPGRDGEREVETPQDQWARESNEHQARFEADQAAVKGRNGEDDRDEYQWRSDTAWTIRVCEICGDQAGGLLRPGCEHRMVEFLVVPKSSRDARDREIERLRQEWNIWNSEYQVMRKRVEATEDQVEKLREGLSTIAAHAGEPCRTEKEKANMIRAIEEHATDLLAALASSNSDGEER